MTGLPESHSVPETLDEWLAHLERLHPSQIELGLDRIRRVADRLQLDFSGTRIITVAGTNGKGSTVALLSSILRQAGYRVGLYTSPHIHVYNERVCINGAAVDDAVLCEGFAAVEAARDGVSLTYFEFGTLAALWHFARTPLDFLILEVGLGGRLDAVNIVDPDLAILTNVALDHMDWLGDTREAIGFEKAGIFRRGRPALYGEADMPESVAKQAAKLGARLQRIGRDFDWTAHESGNWSWQGGKERSLHHDALPDTLFNLDNVATVLQALALLCPELSRDGIAAGIRAAYLPGRLQLVRRGSAPAQPDTVLDVAHNPHAIRNLMSNLAVHFPGRSLRIVIAMLSDKDSRAVIALMAQLPACWHVGRIDDVRGADPDILYNLLREQGVRDISRHDTVSEAYRAACADADDETLVLVTGSFFTVGDVMQVLASQGRS